MSLVVLLEDVGKRSLMVVEHQAQCLVGWKASYSFFPCLWLRACLSQDLFGHTMELEMFLCGFHLGHPEHFFVVDGSQRALTVENLGHSSFDPCPDQHSHVFH